MTTATRPNATGAGTQDEQVKALPAWHAASSVSRLKCWLAGPRGAHALSRREQQFTRVTSRARSRRVYSTSNTDQTTWLPPASTSRDARYYSIHPLPRHVLADAPSGLWAVLGIEVCLTILRYAAIGQPIFGAIIDGDTRQCDEQ